jgi:hypothetical protein
MVKINKGTWQIPYLLFTLIILITGCSNKQISPSCLQDKANTYCQDHDWSIGGYYMGQVMNCYKVNTDARSFEFGSVENFTTYRFLESELEDCKK